VQGDGRVPAWQWDFAARCNHWQAFDDLSEAHGRIDALGSFNHVVLAGLAFSTIFDLDGASPAIPRLGPERSEDREIRKLAVGGPLLHRLIHKVSDIVRLFTSARR